MITEKMKPITQEDIKVLGRIVNISTEGIVADAAQIWDSAWGEKGLDQSSINKWLKDYLDDLFNGDVEINGNLTVKNDISAKNINASEKIYSPSMYVDFIYPYSDGDIEIHANDTLKVYNNLWVQGNTDTDSLNVRGHAKINELEVTSTSIFNGASTFNNYVYFKKPVFFEDDVTFEKNITVKGNINLMGKIVINGTEIDLSLIWECYQRMCTSKYSISWVANNQDGTMVASGSISDLTGGASSSRTVLTGHRILSVSPSSGSIYGDTSGKVIWNNISGNGNVVFTVEGHDAPTTVDPTSVNIQDITVYVGETASANITVLPSNASDKSVTYSIADTSKATVNASGVITGVAVGNTTITVTTSNGLTSTANVTVLEKGGDEPEPQPQTTRNLTIVNVIDGVENANSPIAITTSEYTVNKPTMSGYDLAGATTTVGTVDSETFVITIPAGEADVTITYTWEKGHPTIPEGADFITAMNDIMSDSSWGYFDAFGYAKNITGLNFNGGKVKAPAGDSEYGLNTEASDTMVRYVKVDDQNGLYIPNTAGDFELPDYKALSGDSNLDKLFIYGIDRNSVDYMGAGATTGKRDGINSIAVGNGGVTVTKASKDTVDRNTLLVAAAYYAPQDADGKVSQSDCEYIVDNLISNEFFDGAYIMTVKSYGDFSYNTVTDKTVVPSITTLRTSTTGRNVRYPFTTQSGGETSTYASLNVYQSGPFSYLGDETPSLRYSNSSQSTNNTDATVYMNEIPFSFKSTSELPVTYEDGKMTRGNFTYEIIADDWVGITSNGNGTYTLTNKDNVASGTSSKVKVAVNCSTAKTNDHYVDDQDAVVVNPNIFEYPIINVDTIIAA